MNIQSLFYYMVCSTEVPVAPTVDDIIRDNKTDVPFSYGESTTWECELYIDFANPQSCIDDLAVSNFDCA